MGTKETRAPSGDFPAFRLSHFQQNTPDEASLECLVGGQQVPMMVTDPPDNVPIAGFGLGHEKANYRVITQTSGELDEEEFTALLQTAFRIAHRT